MFQGKTHWCAFDQESDANAKSCAAFAFLGGPQGGGVLANDGSWQRVKKVLLRLKSIAGDLGRGGIRNDVRSFPR